MTGKVVNLHGEPAPDGVPAETPLQVLKTLVSEIEAGTKKVDTVYIIMEENVDDGGVLHSSLDNGITAAQAMLLLEMERFDITHMMAGDR